MVYQLSDYGRAVDWKTWKTLGGSGLPGNTNAHKTLGAPAHWKNISLGQIEDACPATGRSLAYFAVTNLKIPELAKPWKS